jgi:hypothetical protein
MAASVTIRLGLPAGEELLMETALDLLLPIVMLPKLNEFVLSPN